MLRVSLVLNLDSIKAARTTPKSDNIQKLPNIVLTPRHSALLNITIEYRDLQTIGQSDTVLE